MLPTRQILEQFGVFSGVPEEDLEQYRGICLCAKDYIEKRMKPKVDPRNDVNRRRLCFAAAACAYSQYLMTRGGGVSASEEVRVGDISVRSSKSGGDSYGAEFKEYFLAQAADLLNIDFIPLIAVGEAEDEDRGYHTDKHRKGGERMSVSVMFEDAIRLVGDTAELITPDGVLEFIASIQPVSGDPDENADALGWGVGQRFKLYAPASGHAAKLRRGDTVIYGDGQYHVRWVKEREVRGEKVYILAGVQLMEVEP